MLAALMSMEPGKRFATHYEKHSGSLRRLEDGATRRIQMPAGSTILDRSRGDGRGVSAAGVFTAAHEADELARDLIANMVGVLSRGLANLILILHPEFVVIGGELSTMPHVNRLFLEPVGEKIDGLVPFEMPRIELFSLHEDAILLAGAVAWVDSSLPFGAGEESWQDAS
jgi:predicted NBD/HSP70 family sugar kinase